VNWPNLDREVQNDLRVKAKRPGKRLQRTVLKRRR
jgi:hypothetical protein